MKRGLEAETHEVDIASSKSQTLALADSCPHDVIILDIFLGPDDGLDICRTLRQRGFGSFILLMTAKGTVEIEQTCRNAGADAYLAKPFSFDDLIATIARFGTPRLPSDSPTEVHAQPTGSPAERSGEAFTESDSPRPTNMTASKPDIEPCISTNMNTIGTPS